MSGVLTIHLLEGTVDGLLTAEIDNWIGKVIVAPRTDLPKLLSLPELKGLGVYILIGGDPDSVGKKIIYVGQGIVFSRLNDHNNKKDFWDEKTVVIVANDNSLNTTHCRYIESHLIQMAKVAQVAVITNDQSPGLPHVSPPDKTRAENFLTQIQVLLPVLGVDYFVPPPQVTPAVQIPSALDISLDSGQAATPEQSPIFECVTQSANARAQLVNNKFVLLQDSIINSDEFQGLGSAYSILRKQLRQSGKLIDDIQSQKWKLTQDVVFTSPSAAAAVVCGFNINGPQKWRIEGTQQTYALWDQARLSAATPVTPSLADSTVGSVPFDPEA